MLDRPGVQIVNLDLIDTSAKALEAGHRFRREDVDLIFLHVTSPLTRCHLPVVRQAKVPVVILNLTPEAATDVKCTRLRKEFTVAAGLALTIIHVTGLGQCDTTINGAKATPDMIVNAGFETPKFTFYQYSPAGAGWIFSAKSGANGSGISANASDFTNANPPAPEGTQVAVLQGTGSISQTVNSFTPGNRYRVDFAAAQRGSANSAGKLFASM